MRINTSSSFMPIIIFNMKLCALIPCSIMILAPSTTAISSSVNPYNCICFGLALQASQGSSRLCIVRNSYDILLLSSLSKLHLRQNTGEAMETQDQDIMVGIRPELYQQIKSVAAQKHLSIRKYLEKVLE